MSSMEILEWTMGWAWPILIVFAVLMAWGIKRITGWNETNQQFEGQGTGPVPGKHCVCRYDEPVKTSADLE